MEEIQNLINRYTEEINTLKFLKARKVNEQFIEGQIESYDTVIADLKSLNEAIVRKTPPKSCHCLAPRTICDGNCEELG